MYVSVDDGVGQKVEGFSYKNKHGQTERVRLKREGNESLSDGVLVIEEAGSSKYKFLLFQEDIPKLIRALQATQKHLGITE